MSTIKETITNILEIVMHDEEIYSRLTRFDVSRLAAMFSYRIQDIEEALHILENLEVSTPELEEEIAELAGFLDIEEGEDADESDFEGYVIIISGAL